MGNTLSTQPWHYETRALAVLKSLCGDLTPQSECSVTGEVRGHSLYISRYAVRESSSKIKIFKNFKERKSFKPEFGADSIYGGSLMGVRAANSLSFYDWESVELVRRIEIQVKHVRCTMGSSVQ